MRIITLNTHSLIEDNYETKCRIFADAIACYKPDMIALQEVNQSAEKNIITSTDRAFAIGSVPMTEDNHALRVARLVAKNGVDYHFVWAGAKRGYGRFDEGLAIMSAKPIDNAYLFAISSDTDYHNWKTRKALVASSGGVSLCSVHLGWWNDADEPFDLQFGRLDAELKKRGCDFVAGDFNSPDDIPDEGYAMVRKSGWHDAFVLSEIRKGHHTASGTIAGWEKDEKRRIDYIFLRESAQVTECCTIFDGERYPVVSDHCGVMADIVRGEK